MLSYWRRSSTSAITSLGKLVFVLASSMYATTLVDCMNKMSYFRIGHVYTSIPVHNGHVGYYHDSVTIASEAASRI
jgi:hypothetical protein